MATGENQNLTNFSQKYLIVFAQEHVNFRIQELLSICSIFKIDLDKTALLQHNIQNPFFVLELTDDLSAKLIASRSILIRSILKLFGSGECLEILIGSLKECQPNDILSPGRRDDSFKINVESFNRKLNQDMKLQLIQSLSFLPLEGDVNLTEPGTIFSLILDHSDPKTENPSQLFFGRLVANGQRHLIKKYSLKTRHFIGNTSMDPQLSLLMANMAKCVDGMFVYDPFVGTEFRFLASFLRYSGSILVGCSHYGAYCIGSDIDRTLLLGRGHPSRAQAVGKWRGKDESVLSNFKMYNLQGRYVDVWMGDQIHTALRRKPMFDAIVTDPFGRWMLDIDACAVSAREKAPYGIREGSKKSRESDVNKDIKGSTSAAIQGCELSDALYSLLDFSARYLVLNGRLVYWLPAYRPRYCAEHIPSHPCLKLLYNGEQILSSKVSRRLITMEKIKEFEKHCESWEDLEAVNQALEGEINSADDRLRNVYNQFRNDYFNSEKSNDIG